jgi:hypothetical protein
MYFSSAQQANLYISGKPANEKGFILFSPVDKIKDLSEKAGPNVILCSSSGEYTNDGYKDGVISGFEYDLGDTEIVEIANPPIKSVQALKKAYNRISSNKNGYMLLLCDGLSGIEESIMTTFYFMDPDFKIIGGSAGDNLKFQETFIYIGSKRVKNVALFVNERKRTQIIKENIYTKTDKTLLVTKADVLNRTVYTFNNRPASTEYAQMIGISEGDLPSYFMNNPLGKAYKDDIFIASPMKVNPDKSITFYCELMENTFVYLLKPENPITVLKQTLKSVSYSPSFVFSINCILRSLKFIQEGIWKDFDREMLSFCKNTAGFISYGEQYYKNHSNQTMVMLIVE